MCKMESIHEYRKFYIIKNMYVVWSSSFSSIMHEILISLHLCITKHPAPSTAYPTNKMMITYILRNFVPYI
jgi:hypothetical protein